MKYIYVAVIAIFATVGHCYDNLVPRYYEQVVVPKPIPTVYQTMIYQTPYFIVTVPVPVAVPIAVAQPVQQTFYWGYPYQPMMVNNNWYYRCRLFNY